MQHFKLQPPRTVSHVKTTGCARDSLADHLTASVQRYKVLISLLSSFAMDPSSSYTKKYTTYPEQSGAQTGGCLGKDGKGKGSQVTPIMK